MNGIINKHQLFLEDALTNRKRLFEEALKSAKRGKVLYIMCDELEELPKLSQELACLNKHYMKMISFLYTKDIESIIESLCSIIDWQNVPATIILDELSTYCDENSLNDACGLVALLIDSASSCSKLLDMPCTIFVSVSKDIVGEEYCNTLRALYFNNL